MSRPKVSVVMPTLNEQDAVESVVADIRSHAKDYWVEILIVDSSSDKTAEIAERLGVKVISQKRSGHGLALRKAIGSAGGDYIITADCDNTYPMEKIPEMVEALTVGKFDLISANRLAFGDVVRSMPKANLWANRGFAFIVRALYGIATHDVTTGMFAMTKELAGAIEWETNYSFPAEIIIRSNLEKFSYCEIPISYKARLGQVTLNRFKSGKAYLRCFLKYRFGLKMKGKTL